MDTVELTPDNFSDYGVCGYKNIGKHRELQRKRAWFEKYYSQGLRILAVLADDGSYQGMIEYIPGELAHRPVYADGYIFIHCIFVGFRKEYKGRGFASALIDRVIDEGRDTGAQGVAVVTRKGSFMANADIFLKKGFQEVDSVKPDFQLCAFSFNDGDKLPAFRSMDPKKYSRGLTVFRSPQCPYSVKNVEAIMKSADEQNIDAELIELETHSQCQNVPFPFGTFGIILNGEVISHHPISNTRFMNILTSKGIL